MDQADHGRKFISETGGCSDAIDFVERVLERLENAERLVEVQDQAERDRVVLHRSILSTRWDARAVAGNEPLREIHVIDRTDGH